VTRRSEKDCPNFGKSTQNSGQAQNCQNIYIKAQFESPKYFHKTTPKYLQQSYFEIAYFGKNVKKKKKKTFAQGKSSPKYCHFFGLLHLFKKSQQASKSNHNDLI
jgi:hypothetical protein